MFSEKLKVLRIVSNLGIGGVQKQLLLQLHYIGNPIEIDICSYYRNGELREEFEKTAKIIGINSKYKYSILSLIKLVRLIKNYNIIHIHKMEDIIPICGLACLIAQKRYILHFHFTYNWPNIKKKILERIFCTKAYKIIAVSHPVEKNIIRKLNINCCNIKCIYNGVKVEPNYHKKDEFIKACIVARLEKFKKVEDFIDIARLIAKKLYRIKFYIIGSGPMREKIESISDKKYVIFLGAIKNTTGIIKDMDIGFITSKKEGLSNSLLEYAANGLSIIASNIEQNLEVTPDHHTADIYKLGDTNEASEKCIETILIPRKRKKLCINSKRRISSVFNIQTIARQISSIYKVSFTSSHNN